MLLRTDGWRQPGRRVLGLPPEPGSDTPPDLVLYAYNGVLGTPKAAIAYAHVLIRATPRLAAVAGNDLHAEGRDNVWHVTQNAPGSPAREVMTLSQINGKVLSGDL